LIKIAFRIFKNQESVIYFLKISRLTPFQYIFPGKLWVYQLLKGYFLFPPPTHALSTVLEYADIVNSNGYARISYMHRRVTSSVICKMLNALTCNTSLDQLLRSLPFKS
jgi:hypothetical protein